jgi:hypothetical protein
VAVNRFFGPAAGIWHGEALDDLAFVRYHLKAPVKRLGGWVRRGLWQAGKKKVKNFSIFPISVLDEIRRPIKIQNSR